MIVVVGCGKEESVVCGEDGDCVALSRFLAWLHGLTKLASSTSSVDVTPPRREISVQNFLTALAEHG